MSNNQEWVGGKKVYQTQPEQHKEDWMNQDFGFDGNGDQTIKPKKPQNKKSSN